MRPAVAIRAMLFLALACGLALALRVARTEAQPGLELQFGPEVQLSTMGRDRDPNFDAEDPVAAYGHEAGVYLVVWRGDDSRDGDYEIYGQLVDAETGLETGEDDVRLSVTGRSVPTRSGARDPSVAYNPEANEFLVVWSGDDIADDDFEIYGQRVDAATGQEVGEDDFQISSTGKAMDPRGRASRPSVAFNQRDGEYLVVWEVRDESGETRISDVFGQRLDAATGAQVGEDDFQISHIGDQPEALHTVLDPAVAYNADDNQYLVAWISHVQTEGGASPGRLDQEPGIKWSTQHVVIDATGPATGEAASFESPSAEWMGGTQARYHSGRGTYTVSYTEQGSTVHTIRIVREIGREGGVTSVSELTDDRQGIDESTVDEHDIEIDLAESAADSGGETYDASSADRRLVVTRAVANEDHVFTLRQLLFTRTGDDSGWQGTPVHRQTVAADGGSGAMAPAHPRWQVLWPASPDGPEVQRLRWLTVYHKEVEEAEVYGVITTITRTVSAETPTPLTPPSPTSDASATATATAGGTTPSPGPTGTPTEPATAPFRLYLPSLETGER